MKLRYIKCKKVGHGYAVDPQNTDKVIDASEADSLLSSLGLTFIKATTLEQFIQRSPGNSFTVTADGWEHAFCRHEL